MNLIDYLVRKTTTYKNLEDQYEKQIQECSRKETDKQVLKQIIQTQIKDIENLKSELDDAKNKLKQTEIARRSVAGKLGGLTTKNKRLEEEIKELKSSLTEKKKESKKMDKQLDEKDKQLEDAERKIKFLKKNRRAPNLEEIKDYELKRKKVAEKNK